MPHAPVSSVSFIACNDRPCAGSPAVVEGDRRHARAPVFVWGLVRTCVEGTGGRAASSVWRACVCGFTGVDDVAGWGTCAFTSVDGGMRGFAAYRRRL